jgi:hypothetical protein
MFVWLVASVAGFGAPKTRPLSKSRRDQNNIPLNVLSQLIMNCPSSEGAERQLTAPCKGNYYEFSAGLRRKRGAPEDGASVGGPMGLLS